jgi:hypothetical protein
VTIFACTWIAIHPNVPSPKEGFFLINLRLATIMMFALIAPELIILWAIRQWLMARILAKRYKGALLAESLLAK